MMGNIQRYEDSGLIFKMAANQADSNTATSTNESSKPAAKSTPKDALVMGAILREMGINDYEPRVVNQMLEFTYRKNNFKP